MLKELSHFSALLTPEITIPRIATLMLMKATKMTKTMLEPTRKRLTSVNRHCLSVAMMTQILQEKHSRMPTWLLMTMWMITLSFNGTPILVGSFSASPSSLLASAIFWTLTFLPSRNVHNSSDMDKLCYSAPTGNNSAVNLYTSRVILAQTDEWPVHTFEKRVHNTLNWRNRKMRTHN